MRQETEKCVYCGAKTRLREHEHPICVWTARIQTDAGKKPRGKTVTTVSQAQRSLIGLTLSFLVHGVGNGQYVLDVDRSRFPERLHVIRGNSTGEVVDRPVNPARAYIHASS